MVRITTKVCDSREAGTDDNVWLEFYNRNHNTWNEICKTDELVHYLTNDFGRNMQQTWDGDYLGKSEEEGSCNGFRPIDLVAFRFQTDAWHANLHADSLTLCKVTAQFGHNGTAGYSFWEWNGKLSDSFCNWGDCRSDWEIMDKIA